MGKVKKISNRKKYANGSFIGDIGKGVADNALGLIGLNNVIPDNVYDNQKIVKGVNTISGITSAIAPMALNMVAPGSGTALKAVQGAVGNFNPEQEQYLNPVQMQSMGGKVNKYPDGGMLTNPPIQELPDSSTYINGQLTTGLPIYDIHTGLPVLNGGRAPLPAYLQGPGTTQAQKDAYYNQLTLSQNKGVSRVHANGGNLTRFPESAGTHEQSQFQGIPLGEDSLVEGGETRIDDYIFSDRLKYKGKITYADQSKKIENSYKDTKDDLRLEAKKKHLENLQGHQEMVRNKINSRKKARGGPLDLTGDPNQYFNDWINGLPNSGQTPYNPSNGLSYEIPVDPGLAGLNPNPKPLTANRGIGQNAGLFANFTSQAESGIQGKINPFTAGAQLLGPLSELAYGLKGGDKVNFERADYDKLDPTAAKIAANNAITQSYNAANSSMRNNNLTSGQYMTNRLQSAGQEAGQKANTLSGIQTEYDKLNAGNTEFNSRIAMQEQIARQQEKDAARTYVTNGLNDLGQGANGINRDLQMNSMQNMILQNMGTDNWVLGPDGKPVLRRAYGGRMKSKKC